ncbi:hypothetical protein, partial [Vibrio quintilis]|uniref:hypothetical protein n=1 Tax=Vibrio quintilis TaxID=1117707 RepID=UPI001F1B97CA
HKLKNLCHLCPLLCEIEALFARLSVLKYLVSLNPQGFTILLFLWLLRGDVIIIVACHKITVPGRLPYFWFNRDDRAVC